MMNVPSLSWQTTTSPAVPHALFANFSLAQPSASWLVYHNRDSNQSTVVDWLSWAPGERFVQNVFTSVLTDDAVSTLGAAPLVLDVGANAGFYGLLSLALGAKVAFFDAQPTCWRWIDAALRANRLHNPRFAVHRAQRIGAAVAVNNVQAEAGGRILVATDSQCDGQFSLGRGEASGLANASTTEAVPVVSLREDTSSGRLYHRTVHRDGTVDDVVIWTMRPTPLRGAAGGGPLPPLALVKIDVEGMELGVLLTNFVGMLSRRTIGNLVVEITPQWWQRRSGHTVADGARLIQRVSSFGYDVVTYTLHRCAPYLYRARCQTLLPYSRCSARPDLQKPVLRPAAGAETGATSELERFRAHGPCSQLNTSSVATIAAYLQQGLPKYIRWAASKRWAPSKKANEKVQEDIVFVRRR